MSYVFVCNYCIIQFPLCICNGGTSMFAQDDGAVVIRLEKINGVMVNSESKVVM